jgi:hypothetical protein
MLGAIDAPSAGQLKHAEHNKRNRIQAMRAAEETNSSSCPTLLCCQQRQQQQQQHDDGNSNKWQWKAPFALHSAGRPIEPAGRPARRPARQPSNQSAGCLARRPGRMKKCQIIITHNRGSERARVAAVAVAVVVAAVGRPADSVLHEQRRRRCAKRQVSFSSHRQRRTAHARAARLADVNEARAAKVEVRVKLEARDTENHEPPPLTVRVALSSFRSPASKLSTTSPDNGNKSASLPASQAHTLGRLSKHWLLARQPNVLEPLFKSYTLRKGLAN